jgi:hypothetical protein
MAVQEELEKTGRCSRNYINSLIHRFRTMLRWGVARDLVRKSTVDTIECVQGASFSSFLRRQESSQESLLTRPLPSQE